MSLLIPRAANAAFCASLVLSLSLAIVAPAAAGGRADPPPCPSLAPLAANGAVLSLSARKGRPLTILAIGSSSTEGVAASSPDRSYPARLAATLHNGYNLDVEVRNAGVGGETADVTLTRLKAALATGWADLVIWQVGTNDALRKLDERRFQMALDEGLAAAKAQSTPLILMDQQLMRAHAQDVDYARYVATVDLEGAKFNAPVLGRYAEMKKLSEHAPKIWASLLSPDGVHMNDLGYACLARALAGPIARATARGNAAVR